jgi:3-hydroxy-3-methylglutaryl CoA synthase
MAGISAYGAYVPRLRLQRSAIAAAHQWSDPSFKGKGKGERAIANWDEDALTMAVEAARDCLAHNAAPGDDAPSVLDAIYLASTSLPFADRQNAGIVATALSLDGQRRSLDITGSQRAGTTALLEALQAAAGPYTNSALVVASDKRLAKAASAGELAYGDGAAAMLVEGGDGLLTFLAGVTETADFVDHFRGAGEDFDYTWEERWIRDEGISKIVPAAVQAVLEKAGLEADAVDHFIFPSTIARAADGVAKAVGIKGDALVDNLGANLGECGAAHALVMLSHLLEGGLRPGAVVLVAAFGQGCDALLFRATEAARTPQGQLGVRGHLAQGKASDNYMQYLAFNDLITLEKGMRAERDDYKTALSVTYRKRDMLLALEGGKCGQCGTLQFPRTDICVNPQCGAHHTQTPHSFRDSRASVLTWSADYLTYIPNPPSHYGMITFEDGGRFMTDFTDVDVGELDVGTPVKMMFRIKSSDRLRGFVRYFWKAVPQRGQSA